MPETANDPADDSAGATPATIRVGSPFAAGTHRPATSRQSDATEAIGAADAAESGDASVDGVPDEGGEFAALDPIEQLDANGRQVTGAGATLASAIIVLFSAGCYWAFPGGGLLVASLGLTMGILGISSRFIKPASVCAAIHFGLLVACFVKANSVD